MNPIPLPRISRRDLLRSAIAAGVGILAPGFLSAATTTPAAASSRRLVLVELEGGNDGLNTVIPLTSGAAYYGTYSTKRRVGLAGGIGYPTSMLTGLTLAGGGNATDGNGATFALNPNLNQLYSSANSAWKQGDLAVALGVGYPDPNRSHFRGIDIWHSGSDATTVWSDGWLQRVFSAGGGAVSGLPGHSVILEHYANTPFRGPGVKELAMSDVASFIRDSAGIVSAGSTSGSNGSLNHIRSTIDNIRSASTALATAQQSPSATAWDSYWESKGIGWTGRENGNGSDFVERQCRTVAEIIASGVQIPVFRITLGGFDNHANQRRIDENGDDVGSHPDLLAQLGMGLARLRSALKAVQRQGGGGTDTWWDNTLIMTYSEFGRRVEQNQSTGTDHGTAAPHFILGGGVQGRKLYGNQPLLNALDDRGDLVQSTDFHRLYRLGSDWLGLGWPGALGSFTRLDDVIPTPLFAT